MDKRIKIFAVLAIALFLLATPAAAASSSSNVYYTVTRLGHSNIILVDYTGSNGAATYNNALNLVASGGSGAAQQVLNLAHYYNLPVHRDKASIAKEIVAHAGAYAVYFSRGAANPVDIDVSEGNWDWWPYGKK